MTLSDEQLDRRLAALDDRCDPPESAWRSIQSQLSARRRRWPVMAIAAALAAVSLVLVLIMTLEPADRHDARPGEQVVSDDPVPAADLDPARWLPMLARQPVLDAAWSENEAAIRALKAALADQPDNLLLQEFLAEARLRQSELIELALRVDHLEAAGMDRVGNERIRGDQS